ncbi:MAG: recombinase family protein [Candidatus Obscuribacterales bacterium]|nr:recombinase family protein [Candidatus Obscuribacterales bacterium]
MLVGYARVSKADGSQSLDLQRDALLDAAVSNKHIYEDLASGKKDDRPGLDACLKALRAGDTLVVWKLDRLGRSLTHLVNLIDDLHKRKVGLKVLTGQGASIDTTTASGKLVFGIFAALSEFERELISERTKAGLASARARGRRGGRRHTMTAAKVHLAAAAMGKSDTVVSDLCHELGITRQTLYRYVSPSGALRPDAKKLLKKPRNARPRQD